MNIIIVFCAVALIFIASLFSLYRVFYKHEKKHKVRHSVAIIVAPTLAFIANHFLKDTLMHARPDLTSALLVPTDINSFPSGHAAFMFALAFTLYSFDKKGGRIVFGLAILTGIARVLAGVHYWYDIVGGALFGYVVALIVTYACKRLIKHS